MLTVQDLDNAKLDLQAVSDVTNTQQAIDIITRTGATIATLFKAIQGVGFYADIIAWQSSTLYDDPQQLVSNGDFVFRLVTAHTSGATFDEDSDKWAFVFSTGTNTTPILTDLNSSGLFQGDFRYDAGALNAPTANAGAGYQFSDSQGRVYQIVTTDGAQWFRWNDGATWGNWIDSTGGGSGGGFQQVSDLDSAPDGFLTWNNATPNAPSSAEGTGWQLSSVNANDFKVQAANIGNQLVYRYKNGGTWSTWRENADIQDVKVGTLYLGDLDALTGQGTYTVDVQQAISNGTVFPDDFLDTAAQTRATLVLFTAEYEAAGGVVTPNDGVEVQVLYGQAEAGEGESVWQRQRDLTDVTPTWSNWSRASKVGDFGLGGDAIQASSNNANTLIKTGFYKASVNTPDNGEWFLIQHFGEFADGTNAKYQTAVKEDGTDETLYIRVWTGSAWSAWQPIGGAGSFIALADTPNDYTGQADKFVKVNSAADGLEFADGAPLKYVRIGEAHNTASQQPSGLGDANKVQIAFPSVTVSNPAVNIQNDLIIFNEVGQFRADLAFQYGRTGGTGESELIGYVTIETPSSGVQVQLPNPIHARLDDANTRIPYNTDQLIDISEVGTILRYFLVRDTGANDSGGLFEYTPNDTAINQTYSAEISIRKLVGVAPVEVVGITGDMAKDNLVAEALTPTISPNQWQKPVSASGTIFDSTESGSSYGVSIDLVNSRLVINENGVYDITALVRGSIDAGGSDFVVSFAKYQGTEPTNPTLFSNKLIGEFSVPTAFETYQLGINGRVPLVAGDILIPIVTSNAFTNMTINNWNINIKKVF